MDDCIFCRIVSGEVSAHVIDENEDVIVFLSLENRPLVVPKTHFEDIHGLDEKTASAVMVEAVRISNAVKAALQCDGINLIQSSGAAAGQDVFHFHLHIKPRWKSDGVVLRWNTSAVAEEERLQMAERLRTRLT